MAAGVLVPVIQRMVRPAARTLVREGIRLAEQTKVRREHLREAWEDLIAEARHELETEEPAAQPPPQPTAEQPVPAPSQPQQPYTPPSSQ